MSNASKKHNLYYFYSKGFLKFIMSESPIAATLRSRLFYTKIIRFIILD